MNTALDVDTMTLIVAAFIASTFDIGAPPGHSIFDGTTIRIPVTSSEQDYHEYHAEDLHQHLDQLRSLQALWGIPNNIKLVVDAYTVIDRVAFARDAEWMAYVTDGFAREEIVMHLAAPFISSSNAAASIQHWTEYTHLVDQFAGHWILDPAILAVYGGPV